MRIAFALLLSILICGCAVNKTQPTAFNRQHPHQLRVTTYNLEQKEDPCAQYDLLQTVNVVHKTNSDVVMLQEISTAQDRVLAKQLGKYFRFHYMAPYCRDGSLAVYSKYRVDELQYFLPGSSHYPAWIVAVKTPFGPVQIANLHLQPNIETDRHVSTYAQQLLSSGQTRRNEMDQIIHHLAPKYNTIIVGSFYENDQGQAVKMLRQCGFNDVLFNLHCRISTNYKELGPIKLAQRYDRVFYHGLMHADRVQIVSDVNTRHFPIVTDFMFNRG